MGKLEELRNIVAEWFKAAEDKPTIEKLSAINRLTQEASEEVAAEHNKLEAENKELLKDYKELVTHTSFRDENKQPSQNVENAPLSLEDALAEFMKTQK